MYDIKHSNKLKQTQTEKRCLKLELVLGLPGLNDIFPFKDSLKQSLFDILSEGLACMR